MLEAE
jgi:hypothetical protein